MIILKKEYIHFGSDHFDPEKFDCIKNEMCQKDGEMTLAFGKPTGGFWAAPAVKKGLRTEWEQYVTHELSEQRQEMLSKSFKFTLKDSAKIACIEKPDDVFRLPGRYRFSRDGISTEERAFMNKFISNFYEEYYIDFEELERQGFDGIFVKMSSDLHYILYGWDCSTLLLFNPDVIEMSSV